MERFGIRALIEDGATVRAIDASHIALPGVDTLSAQDSLSVDMEIDYLKTESDIENLPRLLAKADLVICHVGSGFVYRENLRILQALAKSKVP